MIIKTHQRTVYDGKQPRRTCFSMSLRWNYYDIDAWCILCCILGSDIKTAAVRSKNAVCTFVKHSRYFHLTYNFTSIHLYAKNFVFTQVGYSRYCLYIWKRIDCLLLSAGFRQAERKLLVINLQSTYCIFIYFVEQMQIRGSDLKT